MNEQTEKTIARVQPQPGDATYESQQLEFGTWVEAENVRRKAFAENSWKSWKLDADWKVANHMGYPPAPPVPKLVKEFNPIGGYIDGEKPAFIPPPDTVYPSVPLLVNGFLWVTRTDGMYRAKYTGAAFGMLMSDGNWEKVG